MLHSQKNMMIWKLDINECIFDMLLTYVYVLICGSSEYVLKIDVILLFFLFLFFDS